jgi:S1-C subfamily serine protease
VVVTEVLDGTAASEAGVEEGDLLLEWEDRPIERLEQVEKLADAPAKASLLLRFKKGQYRYFALLQQRGRKKP